MGTGRGRDPGGDLGWDELSYRKVIQAPIHQASSTRKWAWNIKNSFCGF